MLDGMSIDSQKSGSFLSLPDSLTDLYSPERWYSTSYPPYGFDTWKEVYRERHEKDGIVRVLLQEMVEDPRNRVRHMDGIAEVGVVHARDVLENIIAGRNGEVKNLTRTYYARKTLKRLRRGWVLDQWRAYRSNSQNFPIWQGCALMAMFSDHELELTDIEDQFQELADGFLEDSPIPEQGDHSLATTPPIVSNTFDRGNSENSSLDDWNKRCSRWFETQINRLKHLIRFFTQEKGFKGNTENYYDPFNSFIDKVLVRKVGIPISLSIIFAELAQRVGIAGVELMGFPQHFMIRYRPSMLDRSLEPQVSLSEAALEAPTFYLDLFHPPHRLLSTEEYESYFSVLNIPRPSNIYRDLPTPPLEIFLRCLRNIIRAVEQTGGAGRIGSDHQTSLYSGITQLLALHPGEEWELYVLWLKYLSNFWPEDIGFIRTSIEDMELMDHRRSVTKAYVSSTISPSQNQHSQHQQSSHTSEFHRGRLHEAASRSDTHFASTSNEIIRIMRAQVRELERMDEDVDVGEIRRRKRPKASPDADQSDAAQLRSEARSPDQYITGVSQASSSSMLGEQVNSSIEMESDEHPHAPTSRIIALFGNEERRRPEPKYYVGEVFRHLIYRYTGVIYGYDLKCEAPDSWIQSMGVDLLPHGRNQPFYNALLADGSKRYVAQVNIQALFREYRSSNPILTHSITSSAADQIQSNDSESLVSFSQTDSTSTEPVLAAAESSAVTPVTESALPTLQFSELGPLEIEAVGQYFEAWDGQRGYYIMNKELRKLYPTEDYL
ncbi:Transglutaminase-like superfamily-domain-containing protein [Lobosporangium transversale]|uniref:Transglutaminase-like superfamily-domain-containing protein n=1 Tax=Lobosporangium transversale TaxID=64571 RepID=A0A1Y2H4U8_9FUNG|nr:Transglutaminase-like superfamily-domain-containing protein [Lobosporangium transversale]ORZ28743.1 Transglutaminase-like superfamily-domain-containing protein [Lobosporangium transversale]|eukprot:XP_021886416.1 Transglutaminase-like superfamily-domain-containing protein [Lobosporangium transversale]